MSNNDSSKTATQLSTRGPVINLIHVNREMKMYAVQENELKIISVFNSQMTLWSSICISALSFMASCTWGLFVTDIDFKSGIAFLIATSVFALISAVIVWRNYSSKKDLIDNIQERTNVKE